MRLAKFTLRVRASFDLPVTVPDAAGAVALGVMGARGVAVAAGMPSTAPLCRQRRAKQQREEKNGFENFFQR